MAPRAGAATTIVLEPSFAGADAVRAAAVLDFLQVELSNHPDLKVVERRELNRLLGELALGQQALTDAAQTQRLGAMLGARYFVRVWTGRDGEAPYLMLRVTQVDTTLIRTRMLPTLAEASATETALALAGELLNVLAAMDKEITPLPAPPVMPDIAADLERPVVMVVIPETHVSPQALADPAGETELIAQLLQAGFQVVDSEYAVLSRRSEDAAKERFGNATTTAKFAESRGADVLLYGEAISERATALGDFVGCRARVELKAIHTRTEEVLAIDRAVSGATDTSEAVAAKRAIEQATRDLSVRVIPALVERWNAK
jgi:hypothetical protein